MKMRAELEAFIRRIEALDVIACVLVFFFVVVIALVVGNILTG